VTQSDQFFILHQKYSLLQQEHANVLNQLSLALQAIANQSLEIQVLKDEIARLKGASSRPKLPPNRLEGEGSGPAGKGNGKPGRGKHPRKNKTGLNFQRIVRLKPDNLSEGAKYKGASKYDVQDIVYQAFNTRYLLERWELPDGTSVHGNLPLHIQGHYGAALRAHVIQLAHSSRVPEELILEQLRSCKIAISAGQLSKMLTEDHDAFHVEKEEILKAALESGQIQTDDVGTRHKAKNCYTNVICGEFFVYLSTTNSKSRINFLTILAQGRNEYRFNQDSLDYLAVHKGAEKLIQLCWIHEERHYRKLVPAHPEITVEIEKVRDGIWQLYKDLKNYKEAPTELERIRISQSFEDLFRPKQPSLYQVINDRLALTYAKRNRLLVVLDRPTTPLHNNLSEIGGRGAKVKSKISGGTRSDLGRRAWDTFGSLNLTCRRLGISFYDFLMDRLLGLNKIARLGDVIGERIQSVVTRNAVNDLAIVLNVA